MSDHTPLRTPTRGRDNIRSYARRTQGNDRTRTRGIVQPRLEVKAFGSVFLNKVRFGERLSHTWREAQPVMRTAGRQAVFAERFPGFVNVLTKTSLRIGGGVGCNYAESAGL
jgi:hypothetical protein